MFRYLSTISLIVGAVVASAFAVNGQTNLTAKVRGLQPHPISAVVENDRSRDGLVGPVRRVRTEIVKLVSQDGRVVEGKRALLEVVAYDIKGNKIENQYFPVSNGTLTGKEVYKYDEKGNIGEMTLVNADGTLISREMYKYEFDFAGNWNKMTTSVAVVDGGKISFEPTEVTYRSIMYYLDENMEKMVQPGVASNSSQPAPSNNVAKGNPEIKVPIVPSSAARKSAKKSHSPTLPNAVDRINGMESADMTSLGSDADPDTQTVVMDSEPPSPTPPRPLLKPVSGGVLNGTALSLPAPLYPDAAKRMRIGGTVSVSVVVDETGRVIAAEATGGPATLREPAIQAALRARFSPTKLSGQPVKVSGLINYKFALSQ